MNNQLKSLSCKKMSDGYDQIIVTLSKEAAISGRERGKSKFTDIKVLNGVLQAPVTVFGRVNIAFFDCTIFIDGTKIVKEYFIKDSDGEGYLAKEIAVEDYDLMKDHFVIEYDNTIIPPYRIKLDRPLMPVEQDDPPTIIPEIEKEQSKPSNNGFHIFSYIKPLIGVSFAMLFIYLIYYKMH